MNRNRITINYPADWPLINRHLGEHHDQTHHGKRRLSNGSGSTLTKNQRELTNSVLTKVKANSAMKRFIEKQVKFLGKQSDLSVALNEAKTVMINEAEAEAEATQDSASSGQNQAISGDSTPQVTNHPQSTQNG